MVTARSEELLSLPAGGGALAGIGETFTPDVQTGTGNLSVPISVPPGRNGHGPVLALAYDTASPNGPFGLGWALAVPAIRRRTAKGVPPLDAHQPKDHTRTRRPIMTSPPLLAKYSNTPRDALISTGNLRNL